jgi:hypothetical protein
MRSSRRPWFRTPAILMTCMVLAAICGQPAARAADFGAKTSGNWNSSATWTPTGVPGLNDVAGIGSTYPNGAATSATVLLTQNQQANTVYLGYGAGTSGTLNLGNFNLTADYLYLGFGGGTGSITRGSGYFDVAGSLQLTASTLAMSTTDRTKFLYLRDGSSVTTAATGNITHSVVVDTGSTLALGADLYLFSPMDTTRINVRGDNSTLDAQGYRLTATEMYLGWYGGGNARLLNKGQLVLGALDVANQNFYLEPIDQVQSFNLSNGSTHLAPGVSVGGLGLIDGSTATTTEVGNITGSITVQSGGTLTLGADLSIGEGSVDLRDNSTLDAQGHRITAGNLFLGWFGGNNVRLLNRGNLTLSGLAVANHNFDLFAGDQVTSIALSGATSSTSATGNITYNVDVASGSTLTLGADLNVSGIVQVYGDNSTLNAQGHKITADTLLVGYGTNIRFLNRGDLAVTTLYMTNQTINLGAADQVTNFQLINGSTNLGGVAGIQSLYLQNSSATTTATGNLTGSVEVFDGSTLTLGADLAVGPNNIEVNGNNSTINAQGHAITARTLNLIGGNNVQLLNDGAITVGTWYQGQGIQVELHDGNDTVQSLILGHTSDLRIKSAATGFTLGGTTGNDLQFNGTSTLTLELDGSQPGWVFRWANPAGGDHIADLNNLIGQNLIVFSATNGGEFNIVSQNGYTYIVQPVPEPGAILAIAGAVGLAAAGVRRRLTRRARTLTHAKAWVHPAVHGGS